MVLASLLFKIFHALIIDFEQVNVARVISVKKLFTYRKTRKFFEVNTVAKQIKDIEVSH